MEIEEKRYINHLLKLIFEKSQETLGFQKLEKLIKKNYKGNTQKEKEDSLLKFFHIIKTEMFDSQYKKYIIHGDMTIFYSLFCMFKSTGINSEHNLFFELIEPLFEFFQKKDGKIVCCSVNILIKIIRGNKNFILNYFNSIFDKLIILILRKEIEIRNSGYFLDEIMKNDIGIIFQENYSENNEKIKSNLKSIIDYLIKKLGEEINYPALNILIVSWFDFFETIPKINLINNYIQIIPKLFKMLRSKAKEEISSSEFCLKRIIKNIDMLYEDLIKEDWKIIHQILEIIINNCDGNETNDQIKKCAFELLEIFLKKFKKIIEEYNDLGEILEIIDEKIITSPVSKKNDSSFTNESDNEKNGKEKVKEKSDKKSSIKNFNFNNSINSNNKYSEEIVNKDQERIKLLMNTLPFKLFPSILEDIILNTIINSNRPIIYNQINKCNSIFMEVMDMIRIEFFKTKIEQKSCFENVIMKNIIDSQINETNINLIFDWITLLYKIHLFPTEEYLKNLIFIIPEINEINIIRILDILNKISSKKSFNIIEIIIKKLNDNPEMIYTHGIIILKQLLKTIKIVNLFEEMANILLINNDIYFVMRMINLLNKFLIMEEEAEDIRNLLSSEDKKKKKHLFEKLFTLWSFNPFCTLILVLLGNNFELGYFLILHISQMKLKAEDYIELGQVVQVFEISVFNNIRIKLLNANKYEYLIKTLYAILLLLPQGQAFDALNTRLRCLEIISSLDDDEEEENEEDEISSFNESNSSNQKIDFNFSKESSNSVCSNFDLSNNSFKNLENECNEIFPLQRKNADLTLKKTRYADNKEDEIYHKKGLIKFINIFVEIQNKKKDFETKINESGQIRQVCYSPTFYLKRNINPKSNF